MSKRSDIWPLRSARLACLALLIHPRSRWGHIHARAWVPDVDALASCLGVPPEIVRQDLKEARLVLAAAEALAAAVPKHYVSVKHPRGSRRLPGF